jgi:hypothetical protein
MMLQALPLASDRNHRLRHRIGDFTDQSICRQLALALDRRLVWPLELIQAL